MFSFSQLHAGGKDEVGVVLFGTADTSNALAQDDQYSNITAAWQPAPPNLELLKYLLEHVQPGPVSADCILMTLLCLHPVQCYCSLYAHMYNVHSAVHACTCTCIYL